MALLIMNVAMHKTTVCFVFSGNVARKCNLITGDLLDTHFYCVIAMSFAAISKCLKVNMNIINDCLHQPNAKNFHLLCNSDNMHYSICGQAFYLFISKMCVWGLD